MMMDDVYYDPRSCLVFYARVLPHSKPCNHAEDIQQPSITSITTQPGNNHPWACHAMPCLFVMGHWLEHGGFHKFWYPIAGWFVMEHTIDKWMMTDWGYPHDSGNLYLRVWLGVPPNRLYLVGLSTINHLFWLHPYFVYGNFTRMEEQGYREACRRLHGGTRNWKGSGRESKWT